MKRLTVEDVMALRPCYSKEKVEEIYNGRDSLSLLDILDLDIPAEDRIWVLMRPGVLLDAILKEFADMTVDRAVRQHCLNCGLPVAEAWAARWIDGSDRSPAAARDAYNAAWAARAARAAAACAVIATRDAAWAARAAVAWAARDVAWAARAADAAWAARAADAAWAADAACATECQRQVADLRQLVSEESA